MRLKLPLKDGPHPAHNLTPDSVVLLLNVRLEYVVKMPPPTVTAPRSACFEHIMAAKDTNVEYEDLPRKSLTTNS